MKKDSNPNAFEIVKSGYDQIARRYVAEREQIDIWNEIKLFCSNLPTKARVLDVGCGTGIPIAQQLIENGFDVVGIDLSEEMIRVATENIPGGTFLQMNMTDLDFPAESFDGLIACYSIFHVPRKHHAAIFKSFARILKPGALMLGSVGASEWEGVENYYGVDMFWSHFNASEYKSLITEAGFEIVFAHNVEDGGETHHWVLARPRRGSY